MKKLTGGKLQSAVVAYTFPLDCDLPEVGDLIEDSNSCLLVLESDKTTGYLKVMVMTMPELPSASEIEVFKAELEAIYAEEIARKSYEFWSEGLTSLVSWDMLPESEKDKYLSFGKRTVSFMKENSMLSLT